MAYQQKITVFCEHEEKDIEIVQKIVHLYCDASDEPVSSNIVDESGFCKTCKLPALIDYVEIVSLYRFMDE